MTRGQVEQIRYAEAEWKAGYAAAVRHKRWTVAGVIVAAVVVLRRHGFPYLIALLWVAIGCLCLWPIVAMGLVLEHRRRKAVRAALVHRHSDDPFPPDPFPRPLPG
jgi:uncharacterized membrane protein YkvI